MREGILHSGSSDSHWLMTRLVLLMFQTGAEECAFCRPDQENHMHRTRTWCLCNEDWLQLSIREIRSWFPSPLPSKTIFFKKVLESSYCALKSSSGHVFMPWWYLFLSLFPVWMRHHCCPGLPPRPRQWFMLSLWCCLCGGKECYLNIDP